jgi:predicted Zn-dependent protease
MRLFSLTIIVVIAALILVILLPVPSLQISSSVLSDSQQQQVGGALSGISLFLGMPVSSAAVYEFLISKNPESSDLYRLRSDSQLAAHDTRGALDSLDTAIAKSQGNPLLLNKKARILIQNGKAAEAEKILDQIVKLKTDNPEYLSVIADITLEKALYPEAFDRYSALLALRPGDGLTYEKRSDVIFALLTIPTASFNASSSLKKQDLYAEGIQGYQRAIQLQPGRSAIIKAKMAKRSDEYTPKSIEELEARYQQFRYLQPGEKPSSSYQTSTQVNNES